MRDIHVEVRTACCVEADGQKAIRCAKEAWWVDGEVGGCFLCRERQRLRVPCPTAIVRGIQEGIAVDGKTAGRPAGGCIQKAQPHFRTPKRQVAGWRRVSRSSEHHGNLPPRLPSIGRAVNLDRLCARGNRELRQHPTKLGSDKGDLGDDSVTFNFRLHCA